MPDDRPSWPNGARCAVTLTFDNFGESFDLLRYGHACGAVADGVYAPRRGVEHILDLLDRNGVTATFFLEGWNVRKYASLAREIVARGHEVASHGWMHENWGQLAPPQERDLIKRTTDALGEVLGRSPRGWRSPSGLATPSTLSILHEAGYVYDSSFGDDDIPYLIQVAANRTEELVELPWTWTLDDAPYYAHPGTLRRPTKVLQLWTEEFDAAYQMTGSFMLVCHPRYSGRPARLLALERLVAHIRQHEGVWFARCEEIAAHARAVPTTPHYPAPEVLPAAE